jgi:tRNA(Arg) A34 adenosine deaminase TadA
MLQARDLRYMNFLRRMAGNVAPVRNARLASALVLGNNIISVGYNRKRSDPFQARFGKNAESIYMHAEIHAIKQALNYISADDFRKSTLYVARVKRPNPKSRDFVDGQACPCLGCKRAILEFGIKRVIHTTDDNLNMVEVHAA